MQKYHLHIYPVMGYLEIDIEAESECEARQKALDMAKDSGTIFNAPADCDFIVIIP